MCARPWRRPSRPQSFYLHTSRIEYCKQVDNLVGFVRFDSLIFVPLTRSRGGLAWTHSLERSNPSSTLRRDSTAFCVFISTKLNICLQIIPFIFINLNQTDSKKEWLLSKRNIFLFGSLILLLGIYLSVSKKTPSTKRGFFLRPYISTFPTLQTLPNMLVSECR